MKQLIMAETGFLPKVGKQRRRVVFLAEMETVGPWFSLEVLIEPFYPKKGNGRLPISLPTLLLIYFMRQWFGYSDPAMEEALHDVPLLRRIAGVDAFEDVMLDERTILRFRHLLETHDLAVAIFAEGNAVLSEKGLSLECGTVVDATLIAAPSSTKNEDKQRDSESGLVHNVEWTTAQVDDITMMESCLHGEETRVLSDRVYHKKKWTIDIFDKEGDLTVMTPTKKPAVGQLSKEQKTFNRILSAIRVGVEHPFRVVKRQFGCVEVRYRGLTKNSGQIVTLFALTNMWLARKRLLPLMGEVRP